MRLRTQLRLIPLLLCCFSGSALAAGLPPLVVSPDLVRGGTARTPARPAPADARPAPAGEVREQPAAAKPGAKAGAEGGARSVIQPAAPPAAAADLAAGATEVRALRIRGTHSVELVAEGEAELQRDDLLLSADKLVYRELEDEAQAEGNVRLTQGDDSMSGPQARLKLAERVGAFESPEYRFSRSAKPLAGEAARERSAGGQESERVVSGGGHADVMYFEGENQYRLKNATWSTCEASDPDWYIKAADLRLDYDREVGVARGASVVFQGVPMLWWPWAEFPLVGQRQSGFLAPTYGASNKVGLDISIPYYWNIAPNYDATIAPRIMGRRGVQLATEFRYLTATQRGESRVEWLPRDNVTGEERALGSFQHQQIITPSLFASVDWNGVTDKEYFEDLSSRLSVASRVNLVRSGSLNYAGSEWWNASALVQSYQTLSGGEPYRRLPQLLLNANRSELPAGTAFAFRGEYVKFDHPDANMPEGSRFTLYPQVSLPFERAGYYVTPKLGLHHTQYSLDRGLPEVAGGPLTKSESITRSLPIFSIDSGLTFEREADFFGRNYLQTLEPRVYYVKVPHREQDDIPLFDTSRYDFGFAQIFSENLYSGGDRIADANQVTAAVTSRLIDPETGAERLRATVGQRFYFDDQRVTLPGEVPRTGRRADVLAAFSGRVAQAVSLDSAWQYNPRDTWTERFNFGVRYQPDYAKALNLSYRYSRDILQDLDVSGQWPLGGRWYGVGRVTRSLKENRVTETIAGLEYDGGCWAFRAAVHRFATNPDDVTQAVFLQLELNDLASVGSSPVNLLKRSVAGYGKINEPIGDRVFGSE
ncbi:LPS-assembly protein LptD [Aromatoleum diolicum]|uniref:LPS-assembly protein LptD n=1 Tax=Aromatoleum diolicum TaxID=75796 RepID=A0ABX1Q4K2_9RHOO|nr:LPS-assembly protein LptD [Aromatoleum diolicum]NMG73203.1 LPS assembly protein LptD [Aromatoleum diolicum]